MQTFEQKEDTDSCFPKRISTFDSFYLRTIFCFVSGHFQPFPSHTESPLHSLNLLMMLGTIHDKIFKSLQFYMEKQNSDIVPQFVDIVFADKWICEMFFDFITNHSTDLLPVNQINCKMLLQLFLFSTAYFSSLSFPPSQIFWDVSLPSNSKWANILNKTVKGHSLKLNMFSIFCWE